MICRCFLYILLRFLSKSLFDTDKRKHLPLCARSSRFSYFSSCICKESAEWLIHPVYLARDLLVQLLGGLGLMTRWVPPLHLCAFGQMHRNIWTESLTRSGTTSDLYVGQEERIWEDICMALRWKQEKTRACVHWGYTMSTPAHMIVNVVHHSTLTFGNMCTGRIVPKIPESKTTLKTKTRGWASEYYKALKLLQWYL